MPASARAALTPIALGAMELLHHGPKHPYEIHQTLRNREAWRLFRVTPGSLYHAIERLERDGLIEAVETARAGRRPERTTYRLTEAGRDAFAERLRSMLGEPATEYPQYPVGIAFAHTLARSDVTAQLRRRLVTLRAGIAAERVVARDLADEGLHPLFWADVDYSVHMREAELAWTQRLLDRLDTGELTWPHTPGAGPDDVAPGDVAPGDVAPGGEQDRAAPTLDLRASRDRRKHVG